MKILITGGAGFIGSELIRHIIENTNHTVVNLDKLTYAGNLESLAEVADSPRYSFAQVDICDRAAMDQLFAAHQPDAIEQRTQITDVQRGLFTIEANIGKRAFGAFLSGACQHGLELGVWHAYETLVGSGWCHRDPPSTAQPILQPQKDV